MSARIQSEKRDIPFPACLRVPDRLLQSPLRHPAIPSFTLSHAQYLDLARRMAIRRLGAKSGLPEIESESNKK